jgi:transcription elongation factor Elf1
MVLAAGAGLLYPSSPMRFLPLTVSCPACGSGDVVYSCTPDCCFNHVCNACLASFELSTNDLGEKFASGPPEPAERDSCAPTVGCARCGSLQLFMIEGGDRGGRMACSSCHTLLELEFVKD